MATPAPIAQRSSTSALASSTLPCRFAHSDEQGDDQEDAPVGRRASRASSQTSAAKSGIAKVCARAVDGTSRSITGLATAAIQVGEPPSARAASIAMQQRDEQARRVDERDERGGPPSE